MSRTLATPNQKALRLPPERLGRLDVAPGGLYDVHRVGSHLLREHPVPEPARGTDAGVVLLVLGTSYVLENAGILWG
ncbi:hypothetical protein JCM13580A_00020 [Streptomyces drozdowiczii]